jgi:hypothetical protein
LYSLLRSFAKPPKAVQTVCECIVIMRKFPEVSWKSAKAMMAEPNFLKSLQTLDVDSITGKQTVAIKGRQTRLPGNRPAREQCIISCECVCVCAYSITSVSVCNITLTVCFRDVEGECIISCECVPCIVSRLCFRV